MSDALSVGVIGLGQMGSGVARNLARARQLRAVWDTNPVAREGFGVDGLEPDALSAVCDVVLLVLPGSREIGACLEGLLAPDRANQVLVDLTTSHPVATAALAAAAALRGRAYIDAGMTGGAMAADAGQLTLMVGGEAAALARCRPVLDRIAKTVFHMGGTGTGHAMKLIHNMITHTIFLATSEGGRMAEKAGLDLGAAVQVLNAGNARSFISEQRFPRHILSGSFDGRSRVANLAKDLAMAADFARALGQPAAYGPVTARLLARALEQGMAETDFTRLYAAFDDLVGDRADRVCSTADGG